MIVNPPSNLVRCKPAHLRYLSERMRQDEIDQRLADTGDSIYNPLSLVLKIESLQGPKFTVLRRDGYPAAAGGYFYVGDGTWQSWMVGTMDGWDSNWRSLTKATRWLMDALFASGAKKIQTLCVTSRKHAMEWYARGLRMECEKILPHYAADGSDVAVYVRGG